MLWIKHLKQIREVNGLYRQNKKLDEKTNDTNFKKSLNSFYTELCNNKKINAKSFLEYRYNSLQDSFYRLLSNLIIWTTAFIPTVCLGLFNENMFENIDVSRLILAFVYAFLIITVVVFLFSLFTGLLVAPWICILYPKKQFEWHNIELNVISKHMEKHNLVAKIDRKKIACKALVDGVKTLLASTVVWLLYILIK